MIKLLFAQVSVGEYAPVGWLATRKHRVDFHEKPAEAPEGASAGVRSARVLADLHGQLLVVVDLGLGALVLLVQLVDLVLDEADLLEAAVLFPRADEAPGTVGRWSDPV